MNDAKLGNWYCTASGQMMGGIVSLMIEDHDWDKHFFVFFLPLASCKTSYLLFLFPNGGQFRRNCNWCCYSLGASIRLPQVLRFSISTLDSWTCNIQQLSSSWLFFTWHFSLRLFCIILAYYFNNILSHSLK